MYRVSKKCSPFSPIFFFKVIHGWLVDSSCNHVDKKNVLKMNNRMDSISQPDQDQGEYFAEYLFIPRTTITNTLLIINIFGYLDLEFLISSHIYYLTKKINGFLVLIYLFNIHCYFLSIYIYIHLYIYNLFNFEQNICILKIYNHFKMGFKLLYIYIYIFHLKFNIYIAAGRRRFFIRLVAC